MSKGTGDFLPVAISVSDVSVMYNVFRLCQKQGGRDDAREVTDSPFRRSVTYRSIISLIYFIIIGWIQKAN